MTDNDISRALRADRPRHPDVHDWAGKSRRKARNRRFGVVAVALVAAVGIAVPLAVQNLGGTPPVVLTTPSPADSSTATALVPDACVDPLLGASPLVDDNFPDGATRMWLCGRSSAELVAGDGEETRHEHIGFPDPLGAGVDEAVAAFNALDTDHGVMDCLPNPLDYTVVVEYGDGEHRAARVAGCGELRDIRSMNDVFRGDGAGYLETLQDLWETERQESGYQFTGTDHLCQAHLTSVLQPVDPSTITRAVGCVEVEDRRLAVELSQSLNDDIVASVRRASPMASEIGFGRSPGGLVLLTPTGDPITLMRFELSTGSGATEEVMVWNDSETNMTWQLGSDLLDRIQAELDEAASNAEPLPPTPSQTAVDLPDERGDFLEPEVCRGIAEGSVRVQSLPANDKVSSEVSRIWLCGGSEALGGYGRIVGPVEPLELNVDMAADYINGLPPGNAEACSAEGGISYHLVLDHTDGARQVIAGQAYGCNLVGGGNGRVGGRALLAQLLDLWDHQRERNPEPFVDDVTTCERAEDSEGRGPGLTSIWIDLDAGAEPFERGTLYRGVICGLPEGEEGVDAFQQRELPADFLLALSQAEFVPPAPGWEGPATDTHIVALNQQGDPMTFLFDADGDVVSQGMVWTPEPDLREQLADAMQGLRSPQG